MELSGIVSYSIDDDLEFFDAGKLSCRQNQGQRVNRCVMGPL
jgi:hypothetical protein